MQGTECSKLMNLITIPLQRVSIQRILPCLTKECVNHDMIPFVLPNILLVAEQASEQEYVKHILPALIPIFRIKEPVQVSWKQLYSSCVCFLPLGLFSQEYCHQACPSICLSFCLPLCNLLFTHLPLDKMAAVSQTIFSDAFSWMKSFEFWIKFHWNLFLMVKFTLIQHWFR